MTSTAGCSEPTRCERNTSVGGLRRGPRNRLSAGGPPYDSTRRNIPDVAPRREDAATCRLGGLAAPIFSIGGARGTRGEFHAEVAEEKREDAEDGQFLYVLSVCLCLNCSSPVVHRKMGEAGIARRQRIGSRQVPCGGSFGMTGAGVSAVAESSGIHRSYLQPGGTLVTAGPHPPARRRGRRGGRGSARRGPPARRGARRPPARARPA